MRCLDRLKVENGKKSELRSPFGLICLLIFVSLKEILAVFEDSDLMPGHRQKLGKWTSALIREHPLKLSGQ